MTAREVLVPASEKPALAAMVRDYVTEMAAFAPDTDPSAPYAYFDLYWTEPDLRWPFWLRTSGGINAGFALLRRETDSGRMQIAEFFVAAPHRRKGIGLTAARRLIARTPGPWTITQRELNGEALAFWHRVLDGFVDYDETTTETDAVRTEQRFTFRPPPT